jgi:hypothetical protein
MRMTTSRRQRRIVGAILSAVAMLSACSSSANEQQSGSTKTTKVSKTVAKAAAMRHCSETTPKFDPANFVDPTLSTNPFHPLTPGLQWVRGGTTKVGQRVVPHEIITTMTDVIRDIEGVQTVAMLDESTDSGEVSQVGMDYMALDKQGNVWIVGGYTEEYQGGAYTNTESAWLGHSDGTLVGILAPAVVAADTPQWCIAAAAEETPSVGLPEKVGVRTCVKFGCFDNVRVVREGEATAPDNEHKYYAPGVGVILNIPQDASLHKDHFELYNFTTLSAAGLQRASKTLLDLEAHARATEPDVFGSAPPSRRAK